MENCGKGKKSEKSGNFYKGQGKVRENQLGNTANCKRLAMIIIDHSNNVSFSLSLTICVKKPSDWNQLQQHQHYVMPTTNFYQFQDVFLLLMYFVQTFL